ncbi:MAG TPA: tRNA pseudouridine(55) synthase TruB [Terriglobales bacterium]|jgi:tRNA pseudouridine55 synthase|nr:tRNA pseudouridine(55) synthase TruB [Terriglobales bacterium]
MPLNAVIVVDKPAGWTSHDVVAKARCILGERSIGHLGTLDPVATGVLPLVTGRMTRLCQFYTSSEKAYEGTIRLGLATDTYDCDGEPTGAPQEVKVTLEEVSAMALGFLGAIQQMPPPFSAKKVLGVPAYKLARKKQEVELRPVEVEVKAFDIGELKDGLAEFRCRVSSGTYVRSLAHELGQKLGTGAHLASLRRTAVAEFTIEQSHTLEQLADAAAEGRLENVCVHPRRVLPAIPSVTATEEDVGKIRHGRNVNLPEMSRSSWVKVFAGQSELVCLASRVAGTLFHPKVVLI